MEGGATEEGEVTEDVRDSSSGSDDNHDVSSGDASASGEGESLASSDGEQHDSDRNAELEHEVEEDLTTETNCPSLSRYLFSETQRDCLTDSSDNEAFDTEFCNE